MFPIEQRHNLRKRESCRRKSLPRHSIKVKVPIDQEDELYMGYTTVIERCIDSHRHHEGHWKFLGKAVAKTSLRTYSIVDVPPKRRKNSLRGMKLDMIAAAFVFAVSNSDG